MRILNRKSSCAILALEYFHEQSFYITSCILRSEIYSLCKTQAYQYLLCLRGGKIGNVQTGHPPGLWNTSDLRATLCKKGRWAQRFVFADSFSSKRRAQMMLWIIQLCHRVLRNMLFVLEDLLITPLEIPTLIMSLG